MVSTGSPADDRFPRRRTSRPTFASPRTRASAPPTSDFCLRPDPSAGVVPSCPHAVRRCIGTRLVLHAVSGALLSAKSRAASSRDSPRRRLAWPATRVSRCSPRETCVARIVGMLLSGARPWRCFGWAAFCRSSAEAEHTKARNCPETLGIADFVRLCGVCLQALTGWESCSGVTRGGRQRREEGCAPVETACLREIDQSSTPPGRDRTRRVPTGFQVRRTRSPGNTGVLGSKSSACAHLLRNSGRRGESHRQFVRKPTSARSSKSITIVAPPATSTFS